MAAGPYIPDENEPARLDQLWLVLLQEARGAPTGLRNLFAVLLGGATAMLPVFARDILEVGPEGLGLMRGAPAVGAALVGILLSVRPFETNVGVKMLLGVAAFGAFTIAFALSRNFMFSLVMLAGLGAADIAQMKALYRAELTMADHWFGNFMQRFTELNLDRETIVLFLSDHGFLLGERGYVAKMATQCHPELIHVPLMIRPPEGPGAGKTADYFPHTQDLARTLLAGGADEIADGGDIGLELPRRVHLHAGDGEAAGHLPAYRVPPSSASSSPDLSSCWSWSEPPMPCPSMKICGTLVAPPARCVICCRAPGVPATSLSVYSTPFFSGSALARWQ